jgi:hypothetical protein
MAETPNAVTGSPGSRLGPYVRSLVRLPWGRGNRHLSDDQVLALALRASHDPPNDQSVTHHLSSCPRCEGRYRDASADLETMADAAPGNFDEVFPAATLESQRTRIRRRLDRLVGAAAPARLLDFPFAGSPRRRLQTQPTGWVPAAIVGALLLGLTAGQFVHLHRLELAPDARAITGNAALQPPDEPPPAHRPGSVAARVASAGRADDGRHLDMTGTVELPPLAQDDAGPLTLDAFALVMSDEDFLGSLDTALTSTQVSELASIDALTPRVRDLAINIR